jgi:hypothetical protein
MILAPDAGEFIQFFWLKAHRFWRPTTMIVRFYIRSKVKRNSKWSEDEDNDLYFAWHHQRIVGASQPLQQF